MGEKRELQPWQELVEMEEVVAEQEAVEEQQEAVLHLEVKLWRVSSERHWEQSSMFPLR